MASKIIVEPDIEPVTLDEAKSHLRVDFDDDNALILSLISSARQQAEQICRRVFLTQQWAVTLDRFPAPGHNIGSANWYGPQWGNSPGPLTTLNQDKSTGYEIYLPFSPLQSIQSITYIDSEGTSRTLSSDLYKLDNFSEPARVMPAYGSAWPSTRSEINAIQINLTAGWSAAAQVPAPIKSWILLRIGAMYENRESDVVVQRGTLESMAFADQLLTPYRVLTF